jgi:hypothetical protein
MFKQLVLFGTLLIIPMAVLAQSHPAAAPAKSPVQAVRALTPEQQAQIEQQNTQMAKYALEIAKLVDQGNAAKVWDLASPVAQHVVTRDAFAKQVDADRKQVGKPVARRLAAITRTDSRGGSTPEGYYINVSFATQFANEKQPVRELISFHLDSDRVWRVSGYTLR